MRRGWNRIVVFAAVLVATVACSGGAAQAVGEFDTGGFGSFHAKASNGYKMTVWAGSEPEYRSGQIVIWLVRRGASVIYVAPARVTDTEIEADLGELGRIDLRFEPTGRMMRAAPVCEPDSKQRIEEGSYVGEFEFHGEEGFSELRATSLRFDLHPFIDFVCGGAGTGETRGPGLPGARLLAKAARDGAKVLLRVIQNRPGAPVEVEASLKEKRGRIRIWRSVGGTYSGAAFHFHPRLRSAVLSPPAPFSGFAVFRRGAAPAMRWTGNLAADFPGNSDFPLAGPGFSIGLVHAQIYHEGRFHPEPDARP